MRGAAAPRRTSVCIASASQCSEARRKHVGNPEREVPVRGGDCVPIGVMDMVNPLAASPSNCAARRKRNGRASGDQRWRQGFELARSPLKNHDAHGGCGGGLGVSPPRLRNRGGYRPGPALGFSRGQTILSILKHIAHGTRTGGRSRVQTVRYCLS